MKSICFPRFVLACVLGVMGAAGAQARNILLQLDGEGFDMVRDDARGKTYVSVPETNEVIVIAQATGEVLERVDLAAQPGIIRPDNHEPVPVGTRPHGLALSLDGDTLLIALNEANSIAYLDLDTLAVSQVVVGAPLGDARTWDVIEGKPGRIFVSANPGSETFAYIAMIKRENEAVSRVAGETIIRAEPVFARSPDGSYLYVGEQFSPNSLFKLDLSGDEAPIVLEDQHGAVDGTHHLEVSPDGNRIYLYSGQVLRTSDFTQIGLVGDGIPRTNANGSLVYVARETGLIQVFETTFFAQVDEIQLACAFNTLRAFQLLEDGKGFLLLGDDKLCGKSPFRINAGLNDAWFNSDTAGQGFFIIVFEDRGIIFMAWFTYDTERPPEDVLAILGEPGHRWLTAQGPYAGGTAMLDVTLTSGGVFDMPEPRPENSEPIGTITIEWDGCESGTLSYDIPDLGLMGDIGIRRIVPDNVAMCEVLDE